MMLNDSILMCSFPWLFSFVSAFVISLIKLICLKLSTDKRQAEGMVGEKGQGRRGPTLFQPQTTFKERVKQVNELSDHESCLFTWNTASFGSGIRGTASLVTDCHGILSADR